MRLRIALLFGLVTIWMAVAALPFVHASPGGTLEAIDHQLVLYHKSNLGLMALAYGPDQTEVRHLTSRQQAASNQFQSFAVYPSGSWPEAVASGDWTGDNRSDALLSTSFDWDTANDQRLHLFAQIPAGALTRTQQIAVGVDPFALVRGDFNRDGRDDAAVINQSDSTLGIFTQFPTGTLSSMITYVTGDSPDGLAVGDFNGDLRDDIAVSHGISQSIAVYYQQVNGTFAPPLYFGLSSGGFNDIATGDLNGDGYDDLVVLRGAGHPDSQVAVFYQVNHTFAAPVFRTAEDGGFLAHGLAVGDVTNDGRDDIVVTAGGNVPQAFLNVFVQQSDGTIATTPIVYPAFHLPESVRVGDVNHDGRNDVVAVHASWLTLSVYTQTVTGTLSPYSLPDSFWC